MGVFRAFALALLFSFSTHAASLDCKTQPFGLASGFNLYVVNNLIHHDTDTQGRIAVGGDARLYDYRVGALARYTKEYPYVLAVGQTLTARNGEAENGAVAYGAGKNIARTFNMELGAVQRAAIPFLDISKKLMALSESWAKLPGIAAEETDSKTLTLRGSSKDWNVFTITAKQLQAATYLRFDVPMESSMIVNVTGSKVKFEKYGFEMNGANRARIVFNFQADSLTITEVAIPGAVLAPRSKVAFDEAKIYGHTIAYDLSGDGQVNWVPFTGCLPPCTP